MMKLGKPNQTGAEPGTRDAFHVPAIMVMLSNQHGLTDKRYHLTGGCKVRFFDGSFSTVVACGDNSTPHAIVDPFIDRVRFGDKFWVLLWPCMVKEKLTHHFDLNIQDVCKAEPDPDQDDSCRGCY